jgi:hypothetical protein
MTHDKHFSYSTGGKIEVQSTEASSLRVVLEDLITAYELLPPYLYTTHYMDNTQAIFFSQVEIYSARVADYTLRTGG